MLLIDSAVACITAEQALSCFNHKMMKDALLDIRADKTNQGLDDRLEKPVEEVVLTTHWRRRFNMRFDHAKRR